MLKKLSFLLLFYLFSSPLSASPWIIFGFDGPSIGLGNAMAGGVSGPASSVYNPAGLAHTSGLESEVSLFYARPFLSYSQNPNPQLQDFSEFTLLDDKTICVGPRDNDDCRLAIARYNRYITGAKSLYTYEQELNDRIVERTESPLPLKALSLGASYSIPREFVPFPVAFGGALFALLDPFAVLYQRIKGTTTPYFLRFDDTPHRIAIAGGGGFEPLPWLRLGVGVDFLLDVMAEPDARVILPPELHIFNPFPVPSPNLKDIRFFTDGKVLEPVVLAPLAGLQVSPLPWLELGAAFREEQKARIRLEGVAEIFTPVGITRVPIEILTSAAFTPRVIRGGVRLGPWNYRGLRTRLLGEVAYQRWSTYIPSFGITGQIGGVSSVSCDLARSLSDLEDIAQVIRNLPSGNLFANLLKPDNLCALLQGNIQDQISFQTFDKTLVVFRDTWNPALGLVMEYKRLNLSLGYRYEPSAVGPQTNLYNILDPNRHIYSMYLGYAVNERILLGAFAQLHALRKAHETKTHYLKQELGNLNEASTPDAYPDPNLPDTSFHPALDQLKKKTAGVQLLSPGYPGYSVGGHYLTIGLHASFAF